MIILNKPNLKPDSIVRFFLLLQRSQPGSKHLSIVQDPAPARICSTLDQGSPAGILLYRLSVYLIGKPEPAFESIITSASRCSRSGNRFDHANH
jgi:hypothetical protein